MAVTNGTAAATDATYTIAFTATSAIAAGGTLTLAAPQGTYWPTSASSFALTDADNSGGDYSVSSPQYAEPGQPVFNFEGTSGAVVSMAVHDAVSAGDHLTLVVSGVQNPAAGSDTLKVSTSGDPTPTTSSSYTIAAATSVTAVTVAVTAPSEGDSTPYAVSFTPTTTVPAGGTLTLVGAPGTLWPGTQEASSYSLADPSHPADDFAAVSHVAVADPGEGVFHYIDDSGSAVTLTVPSTIPAGDAVTLTAADVHNPGAGQQTVAITTSSDAVSATSAAVAITARASVSAPTVTTSSNVGLATGVAYHVTAITPVALPAGGEITVAAPPGTVFPTDTADYGLTDTTSGAVIAPYGSVPVASNGAAFSVTTYGAVGAGDTISLAISGVKNPGSGSQTLAVSTSTAPAPATSAAYLITGAGGAFSQVSSVSLATTSSAGSASNVTDTVTFTTSSGGAIAANTGTVTVTAPPGTLFEPCLYGCGGDNPTYSLTDAGGEQLVSPTVLDGGAMVEVSPTTTLPPSDNVTMIVTHVTNAPAGSGSVSISTSGDPQAASTGVTTTAPQAVASPSLTRTTTAAGASVVTDAIDFTTSSTGELIAGVGTINVYAAAGAIFGGCPYGCGGGNPDISLVDHTRAGGTDQVSNDYSEAEVGPDNVISLVVPTSIDAGDHVTLTITRATNPLIGSGDIQVSTSSDIRRATVSAPTTAAGAVTSPTLTVSSRVAGATGATYTAGFVTSATGAVPAGGVINVETSPGTDLSHLVSLSIKDFTHPSGSGDLTNGYVVAQGSAVGLVLPHDIAAGDHVDVVIRGVTNGPAGAGSVTVSTGADTVPVAQSLTFAAGHTIAGTVTLHNGSPAVSAEVQACTPALDCDTTSTDNLGHFSLTEVPGTYAVTVYPPSGVANSVGTTSVALGDSDVTDVAIQLGPPPGPVAGVTLTSPSFGAQASGDAAVVNWDEPTQMTIDPSVFPAGKILLTQVVINGTDSTTGLPASKVVNVGGSINDAPIGITVGSSPIQVTIPALRPIHGDITTRLNYIDETNTAPAPGMTSTQILDLIYPDAPPDEQPTDPLPAYFYNYAYPAGQAVTGPAKITGADASFFSIHPLSTFKVPAGTQDCGDTKKTLDQYDEQSSQAPPSTFCGVLVSFDPPANDTRIYYRAKLVLPVGTTGDSISTDLLGCDSNVADESQFTACDIGVQGDAPDDDEEPEPEPDPDPGPHGTDTGGAHVDPSGTIYGHAGSVTVPLAGATVTLSRSVDVAGPASQVPSGSAILAPNTPTNPETSSSQGAYGWDVLAGYYDIAASATSCTQQSVGPIYVPPPATGVDITLACTSLPARATTTTTLHAAAATVVFGRPVALTAAVPTASTGTVTIKDGTTVLGEPALAGGSATYDAGFLTPGIHHFTATYAGDAANAPSTSAQVTVTVTATRSPTSLRAAAAIALRHTVSISGHAALGATVALFQATNTGTFHQVATAVASKQTGSFAFSRRITSAARFYAAATGTHSATIHVGTTPTLTVRRGHHGKVLVSGVAPVGSRVVLDRRKGHGYVKVKAAVASRTTGRYRMTVTVARRTRLSVIADKLRSKQRRS